MPLPRPPAAFDPLYLQRLVAQLEQELAAAHKKNERLILKSPNGKRWSIGVDDTGALTTTEIVR